ncbi:MAG: nitrate reductase molybdenum cofactor assembly chaperone [Thermoleophilaceae bacterium]|nr:nitrate reductase molybdenum cofactor assembly chaperone [Thermoleophilaceae bacterium]
MLGRSKQDHQDHLDAWHVCSALLRYPDAELIAALPAVRESLVDADFPHAQLIRQLVDGWLLREAIDLQTEYVATFDLGKGTSLYLTWHQYGDRRQRGMELLRLKRTFQEFGMAPVEDELPDWLPLMLEFAVLAPQGIGTKLLEDWRAPLEIVRLALREQESPYVVLLDAISATLSKLGPNLRETIERLLAEGAPGEEVGLEPFGPDSEMMPIGSVGNSPVMVPERNSNE